MPSYTIVEFTPKNKEMMQMYSAKAAQTIAEYQGEFLIKSPVKVLNGETNYEYAAIIIFPSTELAEAWYNSPAYQDLVDLRNQGMESKFILLS